MTQPVVASPCVRICTLDDEEVCIGCGRALAEIVGWTKMSPSEQRAVCVRAAQRRSERERSQPL
jgi:predicted Fe-S protein YdhL (DUF1289 family)